MIIKLAFFTCLSYLAVAFLIQSALYLIARWKGEAIIYASQWGWILAFGLIWLLSFKLAWHFVLPHKFSS